MSKHLFKIFVKTLLSFDTRTFLGKMKILIRRKEEIRLKSILT